MGFIAPKIKVPAPPVAPEPAPVAEIDEVKNDVSNELSEKRRKRKGLEATLLSRKDSEMTSSAGKDDASSPVESSAGNPGSGISADRKTLG